MQVKLRHKTELHIKGEGVGDALCQFQCFTAQRQPLIGVTKQPSGICTDLPRTNTRIVSAIQEPVRTMLLRIIKTPTSRGMCVRGYQLAAPPIGRPGAVMGLETQSGIVLSLRQPQKPIRERAGRRYQAGCGVGLPQSEKGLEKLALIVPPLSKFARAVVGLRHS